MKYFSIKLISFLLLTLILVDAGCENKSTGPDRILPTTTLDSYAAWSAANDIIAYVHKRYVDSDDPDSNGIYIINPDGSGKNLLYQGWYISDPDWSPYGNYIIANSNGRLVRISYPSGQADTLPVEGECWNPVWSPDGRFIAYSVRTSLRMGIYIMNLESGFIRRAVPYCDFPNWITGDSLLYVNQDRNFPVQSICISDTLGYFGRVVMPPQNNIVTYYGMKIYSNQANRVLRRSAWRV